MEAMEAIQAMVIAIIIVTVAVMTPVFIADHHQRVVEAQRIAQIETYRAQHEQREQQRFCRDYPGIDLSQCKQPN